MRWDIRLLLKPVCASPLENNDGGIVTTALEIAVEHGRNEAGVPCEKSGIALEVPLGPNAVAVQEQHRLGLPGMRELGEFAVLVADDAVIGDEMPSLGAFHHNRRNIADPGEPNDPGRFVKDRNAECCAPGWFCRLMGRLDDLDRRKPVWSPTHRVDDRRCAG